MRIGEAAHPGPHHDQGHDRDFKFTLGCCNPSGLNGKSEVVSQSLGFGDIWAISETHLSSRAMQSFRSSMKFSRSPFQHCIGGHPTPPRANSDVVGSWKGVAVVAKPPTRRVPNAVPEAIFASSRALVTCSFTHDLWITAGVVYGEPESTMYPNHKAHNESLIQAVANHVCFLSSGLRFLAGDWNEQFNSIPVFGMLHAAGFKDIQTIAEERWGITPKPTSKGRNRRDYLYLSPELQQLLTDTSVIHDIWADHSVLSASFWCAGRNVPRTVWIQPKEFPWPRTFDFDPDWWHKHPGEPGEKYEHFWNAVEHAAASQCQTQPSRACFGRGRLEYLRQAKFSTRGPIKPARKGEVEPDYHGPSHRHAQWFRQCRRLQAYVRCAPDTHAAIPSQQADQVWYSVLCAKGFRPTFRTWWAHSLHRVPGAPDHCPVSPPSKAVATAIFDTVLMATRELESSLKQDCKRYARLRRQKNPMVIFQDLQDRQYAGVDLLIKAKTSQITAVNCEDGTALVNPPQDWNLNIPIMCNGQPLPTLIGDHDTLWLDGNPAVAVGQTVTQLQFTGDPAAIFQAFEETWKDRWDRHRHVSPAQWQQIIGFMKHTLPQGRLSWDALTPATLAHVIHKKNAKTSKGFDNVSLRDLKAMPDAVLQNFCQMFQETTVDGRWPPQAIAGRVSAVAKTNDPSGPDSFRPICVFSTLYRCFGTYHARKLIRALDATLPMGLYGSRPQSCAAQVWSHMLWAIEASHVQGGNLHGILADLAKAFNFLPRLVIIETLAWMGAPLSLLTSWAGALSDMGRRFLFLGQVGNELKSCTGFAEGCALSCCAMLAADCIFHAWISASHPTAQVLTYVDDWQLMTPDMNAVTSLFDRLLEFASQMDVQVDRKKTCTWSTSSSTRATLRSSGFGVTLSTRSLGAHMQFSRKHTNHVQMARVVQAKPLWPRLRASCATYRCKIHAIRAAAWPRALHGIAATTLSLEAYKSLRSGAMKGILADAPGANSKVHLGLIEHPMTDPLLWTIVSTLRLARDCGPRQTLRTNLGAVAAGTFAGPANSVTCTLATRLQTLGWTLTNAGQVVDRIGTFDFLQIGASELQFRIQFAWTAYVAGSVHHRRGFLGLECADPVHTREWLQHLSVTNQGAFRKLLNGTHMTQDALKHNEPGSTDVCAHCQCSDSRFHRFWLCPAFDQQRDQTRPDVRAMAAQLPESLTCYGWSLQPHTAVRWLNYLASLPEASLPALPVVAPQDTLHAFTDGSGQVPASRWLRYAGWAVVLADSSRAPSDDDWTASGPLPGVLQTAFRAESYAVYIALRLAVALNRSVCIWCDCQAVVVRLQSVLQGG